MGSKVFTLYALRRSTLQSQVWMLLKPLTESQWIRIMIKDKKRPGLAPRSV
jgi:hypothetical protein